MKNSEVNQMCMGMKIQFMLLLFIFSSAAVMGQKSHPNLISRKLTKPIILSGVIEGDINSVKKIRLIFCDDYVFNMDNNIDSSIEINKESSFFKFTLPAICRVGKIRQLVIFYQSKINEYENAHDILSNYVVAAGDNIKITIRTHSDSLEDVRFSGKGSLKYQCRRQMELQYNNFYMQRRGVAKTLGKNYFKSENLGKIYYTYQNGLTEMLNQLDKYKSLFSPSIFQIMKADAVGSIRELWEKQIAANYVRSDSVDKDKLCQFYFNNLIHPVYFSNQVVALSPDYVDYVYQHELTWISLRYKIPLEDVRIQELYNNLRDNYSGQLRERLLMLLIVDPFKNNKLLYMDYKERRRFIHDALTIIKLQKLKSKINNSPMVKAGWEAKAYNFTLPDTSGKMIRLTDFHGKVILLDMWYTGCTGCALFADKFEKEIGPSFRGNSQFKVVSICVDHDKNTWLKSLYSGKYTNTDYINLHLIPISKGPLGFKQTPMIKYYGLEGLPFVILLNKNGRIISQFTNADESSVIISCIKHALESDMESMLKN